MVRIIKNGKYHIVTCNCGCEYSFDVVDIDKNQQVECPECNTKNTVTLKGDTK